MKLKYIVPIVMVLVLFGSIFGQAFIANVQFNDTNEKTITYNSAVRNTILSYDSVQLETQSPHFSGIDIEANEVYLSSQPQDIYKEYVITNPTAGQKVYIHWEFTIWGSGSVNSFYNRIWLRTQNGYDVIDVETHVPNPQAGYIYIGWFTTPWIAPGGNYILSLQVDIYNNVVETNENNNYVSSSFTVTPTNVKFDLEAEDVWLSSQPNDWYKNYVLQSPLASGTQVFFYFQWTIWGVPEKITNPYYFKMTLVGPDGFEIEGYIENPDHRKAGYTIKAFITDDGGNGWVASAGSYTLTCTVDSQNNVLEWNENNNIYSKQFTVFSNGNQQWFLPPYYSEGTEHLLSCNTDISRVYTFFNGFFEPSTIKNLKVFEMISLIANFFNFFRYRLFSDLRPLVEEMKAGADANTGNMWVEASAISNFPFSRQSASAGAYITGVSPEIRYFTVPQDGIYYITFNVKLIDGIAQIECDIMDAGYAYGESIVAAALFREGETDWFASTEIHTFFAHTDRGVNPYFHNFINDPKDYSGTIITELSAGTNYFFRCALGTMHETYKENFGFISLVTSSSRININLISVCVEYAN